MFEYHNNILCVQGGWLYRDAGVITKYNYDVLKNRGWLNIVRNGGNGRTALVEWDTMRGDIKEKVIELVGDPYKKAKRSQFEDNLKPDQKAARFYSTWKLQDGRNLPAKPDNNRQLEYRTNAEVLNALHEIVKSRTAKRKALGGSTARIWERMSDLVNELDTNRYPHTLPSNPRRLQSRYKEYVKDGYRALIHKGYCNDNSRKVSVQIENLLLNLYCLPNKPYSSSVLDLYHQFIGHAIEVVDRKTGELFNPEDFYDEKGQPIQISEATVWNYLNDPKNRPLVDKYRSGSLEFNSTHRPHHHRSKPQYSLSKISMDDRDLPRKMHDGKRVKAYYSYDVTSGCIIGASYSKRKDTGLFIECMRNMFQFLNSEGLGIPMEVEVEHHLVSNFKNDLMKAGTVFPFVRWGNPGNAQEKYAETAHRLKKYGYEKRYQDGIGRFYAKLESNRTTNEKIFDEDNDNYREETFDFERIVADDREVIEMMNNDLHPNQKKYPGMTRMDVLLSEINPNLASYDEALLARYIGDKTTTTIRRSQYVTVQYAKYQLPSATYLERLESHNYTVDAYYLRQANGSINSIHLYQNEEYICECTKIDEYNTATAEQTDADREAYTRQAKFVSEFDAMVKKRKKDMAKLEIIHHRQELDDTPVEVFHEEEDTEEFTDSITSYDAESMRQRAQDSL